jgi:hypothetical protein
VSPAVAHEAQLSNTLGRIEPGWNDLPAGPDLAAALEGGLVALKEPGVSSEPEVAPEPVARPAKKASAPWRSAPADTNDEKE